MDDAESETNTATSGNSLQHLMDEVTRRARIAPGAELGKAARKAQQQVALLQQSAAKSSFQDKLTIGNVAEAVGLTAIGFSGLQLHGAMLAVVEASRDPEKLVAYEVAGKAWFDRRRPARDPEMVSVGVTATIVSAELAQACRDLRLRRVPFAGLVGKTTVSQALELGRLYSATVTVEHKGEELQLVDRGVVNDDVLGKLTTGTDGTPVQNANGPEDNVVRDAEASAAALATSESPAVAANTDGEDAAPAEAKAANPRPHYEPLRPLHRPNPR
jgi:hypothetical protein